MKLTTLLLLFICCCAPLSQARAATEPPEGVLGKKPERLREIDLARANADQPLQLDIDDVVKMVVLGYPELTHVGKIQRDGRVSLPMAGDVPVRGLTLGEVKAEVARRLSSGFDNGPLQLRPEDTVKMVVWRHVELTHTAAVQNDGTIVFPLVGEIQTRGKTVADIQQIAQERLAQHLREPRVSILPERINRRGGAIIDPQVSVLLEKQRDRHVAVLGEVMVQGMVPIQRGLRVLDVLAQAKYNMNNADLNSVVLIRNVNSEQPEYKQLRLGDYMDGKDFEQNVQVQADDVIIVPKTFITKVADFVEKFFTRTKPVFDWWIAGQQARYAEDYNKGVIRLNELLFQNQPR